eukprot:g5042.t1
MAKLIPSRWIRPITNCGVFAAPQFGPSSLKMDFRIPAHLEDLENVPSDNRFYVHNKIEVGSLGERQLMDLIDALDEQLEEDPELMAQGLIFDPLYSCVCAIVEMKPKAKSKLCQLLVDFLNKLLHKLPSRVSDRAGGEEDGGNAGLVALRSALQMGCCLLAFAVTALEKDALQLAKAAAGKKKSAKEKDGEGGGGWQWTSVKEQCVAALCAMLTTPAVFALFPLGAPPQELGTLLFSCSSIFLENCDNFKEKALRPSIYGLFVSAVGKFKLTEQAATNLLHLLQNFEWASPYVAELLKEALRSSSALPVQVLSQIGGLGLQVFNRDPTQAKGLGAVLYELGACMPELAQQELGLVLGQLGSESYVMRNGVVQLLGKLLEHGFQRELKGKSAKNAADSADKKQKGKQQEEEGENVEDQDGQKEKGEKEEDEEEEQESNSCTLEEMFTLLVERAHDVNAFARSKVMQVWLELVEANVLPKVKFLAVAQVALDRLMDKTVQVRRYAVKLLGELVARHPSAANLTLEPLRNQLAVLTDQLTAMVEQERAKQQQQSEPPALEDDVRGSKEEHEEAEEEEEEEEEKEEEGEQDGEQENAAQGNKAGGKAGADKPVESAEVAAKRKELEETVQVVEFIHTVERSFERVQEMLDSKSSQDVLSCIEFLVQAHEAQLASSAQGIRKLLSLVWSSESTIKAKVLAAYRRLYIGSDELWDSAWSNGDTYAAKLALSVANNLISLTRKGTVATLTSLEQLMGDLRKEDAIPEPVVDALWHIFASPSPAVKASTRSGALLLLSMMFADSPDALLPHLPEIVSVGLGSRALQHRLLARTACLTLQKLEPCKDKIGKTVKDTIFDKLTDLILERSGSEEVARALAKAKSKLGKARAMSKAVQHAQCWFPAAEQAVKAIAALHDRPWRCWTSILQEQQRFLLQHTQTEQEQGSAGTHGNAESLAHLFFLVGQIALQVLMELEKVEQQIKRLSNAQREKARDKKQGRSSIEEDLDVDALQEHELEQEREQAEAQLVQRQNGAPSQLLAVFVPLMARVCQQPNRYPQRSLQESATLSLCKVMCVSPGCCQEHLQLVFSIMTKTKNPNIRTNLVICVGDLSFRFPNLVEPWSQHIFARLKDSNAAVRKTTLLVMTHLILNDMMKAKNPIAELCNCLMDSDPSIRALATRFFQELNKKGKNPIYNLLPDVISRLSNDPQVDDDAFRSILKFLLNFINKDKQLESLVEKLCHRFNVVEVHMQQKGTDNGTQDINPTDPAAVLRQCQNLAYCLTQLKLLELFRHYKGQLGDLDVYTCFNDIVQRALKTCKPEDKPVLDELESKLKEEHERLARDLGAERAAGRLAGKLGLEDRRRLQAAQEQEEEDAAAEAKASEQDNQENVQRKANRRST